MGTVFLAWSTVILDRFFSFGAVDIVVNRMLITAGHLTPYYLKVYEEHNWHYWSYSFLSGIVEPTHEMTPGFYVSVMSFNRPDIQSNANMFADGYANLGYLGIIIEAVFLAMVLLLINSSSRGLPIQIVMPTLILPAFALCNGSPFTGFLSFGLGLPIIMFALIPRKKPMESNRGRRRHLSFRQ
ncbi:hypothetical protein [Glutamicibacter nicotianae]|uniref:hypothetical protein n=1 Tax=Glutamicibacter nicotianae TaxID=37929 RepID=UPI0025541E37|nr:hypothetical protein [Glutamicibacter nicotianae]WIV45292.1 hypothetical protein QQS42_06760 [Glutamicibacter nicotianae]